MHERDRAHPALGLVEGDPGGPLVHSPGLQAQQGRDRLQVVLDPVVHLADGGIFGQQEPVQPPHVGDVAQEDHGAGDHAVGQQRDDVEQDDDIGPALDLFDHRPPIGQGPLDRRLLDVEIAEATTLGGGVDTHAVEGVHGVGRGELHPPVGVDDHHTVAHPGRLLGPHVLVGVGEG